MLQRAASNAYSWWWASHIRTKQSKWMEQNLQDMEEKVASVLKLINEDGDSFRKRAEMYYKQRPELINFVEESYRAYRSLAERYDHISKELQNANNTIASFCPDQIPLMDDDDDDASPRPPRKKLEGFKTNNAPQVPKPPLKDLKSVITTATATKKFQPKKAATKVESSKASKVPKSGLSRKEAIEELDRLQKQILSLQTVKEFLKSSYDNAIGKYWETEEQIKQLQEKVSNLQDELGEGIVIDDEEARRLMAEAALKSCQETLAKLQEKQEKSRNETIIESKRIKEVKAKLSSLMNECHYDETNLKQPRAKRDAKKVAETTDIDEIDEDVEKLTQQRQELQSLQEKIKEHFEAGSHSSLSVAEMAEKIDELVNKVVSLETAVSSQTALVKRLTTETDELQSLIRTLEGDKESLINDKTKLNDKLREMEEKLRGVQGLNQVVENQNTNLQTHFTEAHCNLDNLSEKVQNVQPDEEVEVRDISQTEKNSSWKAESTHELQGQDALKQDKVLLLNDAKSDKKLKATALVEDTVNSDKEPKVVGMVQDVGVSNGKHKVTGSSEKDVQTDDKPKVTSSLENDRESENEVKVTGSLRMEEAGPVKIKSPMELKEQEKTRDSGNSDGKTTDAQSSTAGNKEVSQYQASYIADHSSDSSEKQQENGSKPISSEKESTLKVDSQEQGTAKEDEPDWRQLFLNLQDKEKALLSEYTNTLRSYKEVNKKLSEVEKKNQDTLFDSSLQLKELKTANALKDEEIRLLREKLDLLQRSLEGKRSPAELTLVLQPEKHAELTSVRQPENHDIGTIFKIEESESTSAIEEKFRTSIDEILEENLEFWLKFSTTFTEIQKFETSINDLQTEVSKLEERWKSSEGSSSTKYNMKSDARPLFKHLLEIQNELTVWMEKSALLKEELQSRFSSLCEIQEEITAALKASAEDYDFKFTSYQAAKFQGEVLNMKQENHKVADELQAGLDLVTTLQLDVERALAKLNEKFGLSNSKRQQRVPAESRNRVPLRSFIFGVKPQKKKQSIFSCMTPGMHKKYRTLK